MRAPVDLCLVANLELVATGVGAFFAVASFDRCHFVSFNDSSLDYELVYYVPTNDFNQAMDVQQRINLEIMRCFAQEGIAFAFPTRTLQMVGEKPS